MSNGPIRRTPHMLCVCGHSELVHIASCFGKNSGDPCDCKLWRPVEARRLIDEAKAGIFEVIEESK